MPVFNLQIEFDESGAVKATRQLGNVADAAENVQERLEQMGESGEEALNDISSKAKLAKKALELVGKVTKVLGTLGFSVKIGSEIASFISCAQDLGDELGALEGQYEALGARAGWTAGEMEGLEKLMLQNGIGALEARKNVMGLAAAYVEASKGAPLLQAALDSTVLSGKNVSDVLGDMTQAIESGNSKSLESLGIYADFGSAYENMATKLGTTVNALTEQEKAQARVDATLEAATANAGLYEASLDDAERAQNAMNESLTALKLEIADAFSSDMTDLVYALADAVKWLGDAIMVCLH